MRSGTVRGAGRRWSRVCGRTRWPGSRTRPSTCGGCGRSRGSCTPRRAGGSGDGARGAMRWGAGGSPSTTSTCRPRPRSRRRPGWRSSRPSGTWSVARRAVHGADRDAGGVGGRAGRRAAGRGCWPRRPPGLTDRQARKVEAVVLDGLPATPLDGTGPVGPWDGPTPQAFTRRVRTAVAEVRTDVEEQVRRERARTHRDLGLDAPGEPGPVHDDGHRPDRAGPDHRRHLPRPAPAP